jgi:hypothetical protein
MWLRLTDIAEVRAMDLTTIKAKISAGVLPQVNGIAVQHVRFPSGVCDGCDERIATTDIGVQFDADRGRRLLHVDCYVMWTEACGG